MLKAERLAGHDRLILARPEARNAFNDELLRRLRRQLEQWRADCRPLLLMAEGKLFCAGADLNWMRERGAGSSRENRADALVLAQLLAALAEHPAPVLARVQGDAYGGGLGLIACCDFVAAAERARFCLSEVRLGLIPATIVPHVARAIGVRATQRYALGAERFDAQTARELGLVHRVCPDDGLDAVIDEWLAMLEQNGPQAMSEVKRLVQAAQAGLSPEQAADWIARVRATPEAQEGIAAFLEKRPPDWSAV